MPHVIAKPKPKQKKASDVRANTQAVKFWLLCQVPRVGGLLLVIWLAILFHAMFVEAGEFQATVTATSGTARLLVPETTAPNPEHRWTALWTGREVLPNDQLRTGANGVFNLHFAEHSQVRVLPNSQVRVADVSFNRDDAARLRKLQLTRGAIYVSTGTPLSEDSSFTVQVPGATLRGFETFYFVTGNEVRVLSGTVQVEAKGKQQTATAGRAINLVSLKTRGLSAAEKRSLTVATQKLPEIELPDKVRRFLVDGELRYVMGNTAWLPRLIGHAPGDGNPFKGLSIMNSTRLGQAQKRMTDVHAGMMAFQDPPASIRLDDFRTLGLSEDEYTFMRHAFYRGQLWSYTNPGNGQWVVRAQANNAARTWVICKPAGVTTAKQK